MKRQSGSKNEDKAELYARQWFASMAKFHRVNNPATWEFTEEHLIAFLRYKLKQNMPTWKRLLIVDGVIWYRNNVRQTSTPRLEMVQAKLQELGSQVSRCQEVIQVAILVCFRKSFA